MCKHFAKLGFVERAGVDQTGVENVTGDPSAVDWAQARAAVAIVDAAEELFCRASFAAVTVGRVAERAGVSNGLVYHYFPGKRALFRAVYTRRWELAVREARDRGAGDVPPAGGLVSAILTLIQVARRDDRLIALVRGASMALGPDVTRRIELSVVGPELARAGSLGDAPGSPRALEEVAAVCLVGVIHRAVADGSSGRVSTDRVVRTWVDVLGDGGRSADL